MWEEISSFLLDPVRMRQGLEDLVLAERRRDGELETAFAHWTDMLVKTEVKMDRLLDLYLEGDLGKLRYHERVRGELEKLKARRQMIAQLQGDMEELVESYSKALPDDLASLTGFERHEVYRILYLRVDLNNSGIVELGGAVAFFLK